MLDAGIACTSNSDVMTVDIPSARTVLHVLADVDSRDVGAVAAFNLLLLYLVHIPYAVNLEKRAGSPQWILPV